MQLPAIFDIHRRSLLRGGILVLGSLFGAFRLADFPHNRATLWLILPLLLATAGTLETIRCVQRRWSFYHGGVVLCIYMDIMALAMIVFMLLYPYAQWISLR
jgi:hypothetical protein